MLWMDDNKFRSENDGSIGQLADEMYIQTQFAGSKSINYL